jgi:hypothetical protein
MDGGNLAEWAGVVVPATTYLASRHNDRAMGFLRAIEENSEQSADVLMDLMEREDLFSEIVERGLEAASRSASERKRQLLGRVVAAAFSGDGLAKPEIYNLLVKSIDAIESAHVQMLVILATPRPSDGELAGTGAEGFSTKADVLRRWPDVGVSYDPVLAALTKEGLIQEQSLYAGRPSHAASAYGLMLVNYVAPADLDGENLGAAALVARIETQTDPSIVVRNIGPGRASQLSVTAKSQQGEMAFRESPHFFAEGLDPLEEVPILIHIPTLNNSAPYDLELRWSDSRGMKVARFAVDQDRS